MNIEKVYGAPNWDIALLLAVIQAATPNVKLCGKTLNQQQIVCDTQTSKKKNHQQQSRHNSEV